MTTTRHTAASRGFRRHRLGRWRALIALVVLVPLMACGGDDGDEEGGGGDGGGSVSSTTAVAEEVGTGPGTPEAQPLPQEETVTVVYSAAIEAWANILLADALGEFEAENLNVEIETLPGPDGTLLVGQGRADVQPAGISAAVLNGIAAGQPIAWVANTFVEDAPKAGFWIHNDYLTDGEPDPEKLAGTQVMPGIGGGGFGNPGALPLWRTMQEIGLDPDDVEAVSVNTPADAAALLENGSASISLGLTPYWSTIEDSGCCTFLVPTTVSGSFLVNTDFIEDRPEVAQAFFRAIMRTNRTYLQGNYHEDEEVVTALAEATGVPAETLREQPPLGFSEDLAIEIEEVLPDFQEQFRTFDLLSYDEDLDVEQMINTEPVEAILGSS
ncbi:MAG TPA: ABC transporter substrate-binding protein [Iamia sp.]|nr:ABC transporter substrate-binding protein [Iamia sp.]